MERDHFPIIVFLTVCAAKRKRILARREAHNLLLSTWSAAPAWIVGRYVVLPDHIHLFCAPREDVSLVAWVQYWKALISIRWPWPDEQPIWQRGCWDTQLRRDASYEGKWDYVYQNPVRHRLVNRAEDWPYAGELNELEW